MNKISNADFIRSLANKTGYRQKDVKEVLEAAQEELIENMKEGNATKVFSWLTIEPVDKAESVARNPRTGEQVTVPARRVAKAKFSSVVKTLLN